MAFTSVGYERAISYANLGKIVDRAGAEYSIFNASSFAVSAGVGDRAVAVASGVASGRAILDTSDSVVTVNGGAVSSGSRWDLVVLRRNWSTKATTVVIIPGTASKALPGRQTTPGVIDDQPLALVRFAAGQTTVQEIVDLRVWHGNGGLLANDNMVRDYVNRVGTVLRIGSEVWTRVIAGGAATWIDAATWAMVTGKPATFPPSAHDHAQLAHGSVPVRWILEATTGKVYLRDDGGTTPTFPWTILRDGTLALGKVPVDRVTGVLPTNKGGTGAQTPGAALAALGAYGFDTDSVTIAAGASREFVFTLPQAAGPASNYAIAVSLSNRFVGYQWGRSGQTITVVLYNDSSSGRTVTACVTATRKYVYAGGSA